MVTSKNGVAEGTALELKKVFQAPVERVYKAWTSAEQMEKWFACPDTATLHIKADLRPGGEYRCDLVLENGSEIVLSGTYIEVVPNEKLVYSWNNTSQEHLAKDTLVTVEFKSIDNGAATELTLVHSKFDRPVSVQGHTFGWSAGLEKLAVWLA